MASESLDEITRRNIVDRLASILVRLGGKSGIPVERLSRIAKTVEAASAELLDDNLLLEEITIPLGPRRGFGGRSRVSTNLLKDHPDFHRIVRNVLKVAEHGFYAFLTGDDQAWYLLLRKTKNQRLRVSAEIPDWIEDHVAAEAIAEFIRSLSALHQALGGAGLELDGMEIEINAPAYA